MKLSGNQFILFGILGLLLLAVPLTITLLQTPHQTRSNATIQTPLPAAVCGSAPTDVMLIIDRSDSMSGPKLTAAKAAAVNFITTMSQNAKNRVGLISFAPNATLDSGFTNNFSAVKTAVNNLTLSYGTCASCAFSKANTAFASDTSTNKKVAIFLTDGRANWLPGGTSQVPFATAEQDALKTLSKGEKVPYYSIGLGTDVNTDFLKTVAATTGAQYYFAPTPDQLNTIYQTISQLVGKGSITGLVFNDTNNNGVFDASESGMPNWNVSLNVGSPSGQIAANQATDTNGSYSFSGLCDGTYYVNQTVQSGWTQTLPTNPLFYTISVSSGSATEDKNFGDAKRACGTTCTSDTSCAGAANSCTSCTNNTCQINYCGKTCASNADCGTKTTSQCGVCDTNGSKKCVVALSPTSTPTPTNTPTPTPTPTQINFCGKTCSSNSDCQGNGSSCQLCDVNGTHKCVADITPTATPTVTPLLETSLNIDVLLHNIGSSGDNASNLSTLSNKNPLHPNRNAHVFVFDTNNQKIADSTGTISYSSTSGSFKGFIDLGANIITGKYYIKIQSDNHLRRLVSGILPLTAGAVNPVPQVNLVAGDADNDNALTLLDYNMLIGCYSVLEPAKACQAGWKDATDFNDDGNVDSTDYNLFLRELSVQQGE